MINVIFFGYTVRDLCKSLKKGLNYEYSKLFSLWFNYTKK